MSVLLRLFVLVAIPGCTALPGKDPAADIGGIGLLGDAGAYVTTGSTGRPDAQSRALGGGRAAISGFTDHGVSEASSIRRSGTTAGGGTFSLNFSNTPLQEFVRVVFDEILKENIVIDPALTGNITIRTVEPVTKQVAIELTREALQTSGARLSQLSGAWRVSAGGSSPGQAGQGRSGRDQVRVIRLRNVTAEDARQALQPFVGSADLSVAGGGKFLIAGGRQTDLDGIETALGSFDVDELRGRSFALVPLQQAGAPQVAKDLTQMFIGEGGQKQMTVLPIERMNAVMLVSSNPSTLARAKSWIARLDRTGRDERRVHVYAVRNRRATEVAKVLDGMFQGKAAMRAGEEASLAPQSTPRLSGTTAAGAAAGTAGAGGAAPGRAAGSADAETTASTTQPQAGGGSGGSQAAKEGGVDIRADPGTNSLVIVAKPDDYRLIEAAIRNLDIQPTQVLIEATIAEVRINDSLRHGVRWYLQNGNHSASLSSDPGGSTGQVFPGFNYVFNTPNARVVLNTLETVTDVEIISSPALTVLDNQTATLKVGDQVPIATRSARSVTNPDAPIVNDIQLKDTGIILSVTPRVNSSGLVMMDITQEASDVVPTTSSAIDSPTIRQRQITSSVSVNSGAEIILGGLISRKREKTKSGVPLLKDIPVLGVAFTSDAVADQGKTELVIILRPTVMANRADVYAVTSEIKSRMGAVRRAVYNR